MKIIVRNKATVVIVSDSNEYWLTHRTKRRHNGRRQRLSHYSVRYMPIKKLTPQEVVEYIIKFHKKKGSTKTILPQIYDTPVNLNLTFNYKLFIESYMRNNYTN